MSIILNSQQAMTAPVRQPVRNGLRSVQQQPSNMNISEFIATDIRTRIQSGQGRRRRVFKSLTPRTLERFLKSISEPLLRLDKKDFPTFNPATSQIDSKPSVTVLLMEPNWRAATKLLEIILCPVLTHVRRNNESCAVRGRRGVMRGQDHTVFDNHVR